MLYDTNTTLDERLAAYCQAYNTRLTASDLNFFTTDVLEVLAKTAAGEESMSSLKTYLQRWKGWKGLGSSEKFEDLLEVAGFTLRREYHKQNPRVLVRTYVTL